MRRLRTGRIILGVRDRTVPPLFSLTLRLPHLPVDCAELARLTEVIGRRCPSVRVDSDVAKRQVTVWFDPASTSVAALIDILAPLVSAPLPSDAPPVRLRAATPTAWQAHPSARRRSTLDRSFRRAALPLSFALGEMGARLLLGALARRG